MTAATIRISSDDVAGSVADAVGVVLTGPLPPAAVLLLGARVAAAVDAADLVPDAILIDREGQLHLQRDGHLDARFIAPEHKDGSTLPDKTTPRAAVWALGRHLLELSVGAVVDDAVLAAPTPERLAGLVDVEGRPLSPRLGEVLAALLAPDPAERLQGLLPVTRVCVTVGKTLGDGDTALRAAVSRQLAAPLRTTKDLPARAILGREDVERLQRAERASVPTARTILIPELKDVAPRLATAPAADARETRTLAATLMMPAADAPVAGLASTAPTESELPRVVTADLEAPAPVGGASRRGRVVAAVAAVAVVVVVVVIAVVVGR